MNIKTQRLLKEEQKVKISITRGLAELKNLDNRIQKAIQEGQYIGFTTGKKVIPGFQTNEEFEEKIKANYQSVQDLIKRRNLIKSAIVQSNATTKVTIAGIEMTVAEAIERKTSIKYDQQLLEKMKQAYSFVINKYEVEDERVKERLDEHLQKTFGKDVKVTSDQYDSVAKPFLEQNAPKIIDPLKLKDEIDKLAKNISDFLTEVDFALSESNTLTQIEIPDSI